MDENSSILIVDDEPAISEVLGGLLSEFGYNLDFADNGSEALIKAKEAIPDLVLMDVMMPDVDGFEVCRRFRSDPMLAEVPVIMLTGLDDRDSRLRGLESGADDFLTKPFDPAELLARVRTIARLNRYRQLENKINRLSAVYDISSALNSAIDVDALLEFILKQTKEMLDVEGISLLLYDAESETLYFPVVLVEDEKLETKLKQIQFPADCGIAGWVINSGRSILVPDVSLDNRFYGEVDKETGYTTKSILCVPLHGKEDILGVIEAINKRNGEFTEDDQVLLEAMAGNIAVSIEKASLHRDLEKAEAILRHQTAKPGQSVVQGYKFDDIIGNSEAIRQMIKKAEQVALTNSNVLIYGETGTGKELMAQAIHYGSPRALKNFVPINCAAIPENLLESELFGHEKGAFTGAVTKQIGRFEEANNGTLFLDEIGDMPLCLQAKLLRVLEENTIRPLGSNRDISVNVRVIAATQKKLKHMVETNEFRQDLYYRLKVFQVEMPSLQERREDIPLLVDYFVVLYNKELDRQIIGISDEVGDTLWQYDYPGNIRELKHIIESAMVISKGNIIEIDSIPKEIQGSEFLDTEIRIGKEYMAVPRNDKELKAAKAESHRKIEYLFLVKLLSETRGNVSEAARKAEINRSWLSQLVSKHKLDLNEFRNSAIPEQQE